MAPGYQLLLHIDGSIIASRRRYPTETAADAAGDRLSTALTPFNEGEPETVVWVEIVDALPDEEVSAPLPA